MDKKKRKYVIIGISAFFIISMCVIIALNTSISTNYNESGGTEIVPEEEISDDQLRETVISLYYINSNNEITEDIKKIDSKILIENPYLKVMNLLVDGPKSENLKTYIPDGVKINNVNKEGECVVIDFSKEFIENANESAEAQGLIISQIVNTMTQFTEINCVKILVDGESNKSFKNGNISFEQLFTNED